MIHVAKVEHEPGAERTCDMLAGLLGEGGVKAILVSERSEETAATLMMERRGVRVARLLDQSEGRDERQCVYLGTGVEMRAVEGDGGAFEHTFPNQPYMDHKQRRKDGVGRGKYGL